MEKITVIEYIRRRGFTVEVTGRAGEIPEVWASLPDGGVLVIKGTNPASYEQSKSNAIWRRVFQIDGPPKFTVQGVTVIRKTGPLVWRDGEVEWEGFDLFRETILNLVTAEEAIKIIDTWE